VLSGTDCDVSSRILENEEGKAGVGQQQQKKNTCLVTFINKLSN
jgi:hypothetical protein